MARQLAEQKINVLRFDYRGMGDSNGDTTFDHSQPDVQCAIDTFITENPDVKDLYILGLCDGATAGLFSSIGDKRVCGLILINPWLRTAEGQANAFIKSYYSEKIFNIEFYKNLLIGKVKVIQSLRSFFENLLLSRKLNEKSDNNKANTESLPSKVFLSLSKFSGRVLIILSEDD